MNKKAVFQLTLSIIVVIFLLGSNRPVTANQPDIPEERGWSNFRYVFVAGSAFRPRASTVSWYSDGSGGCVSVGSTAYEILNVDLNLPHGSRIDYLRIYYYDTSGSDSGAWITTYNGAGSWNDRTFVQSAGTSGYGTRLSPYLGHVVDNFNNAYVLNYRPVVTGYAMRLCGMRVAYRVPLIETYLPLLLR